LLRAQQSAQTNNFGTTAEQIAMVWASAAKEDNDWVKKCMEYGVDDTRPRGRQKKTWTESVQKN